MVFGASNSTGCSGMHGASRRYDQHQFAAATPLPVRWTSEWPRNGRCRATRMKVSVAGLGRERPFAIDTRRSVSREMRYGFRSGWPVVPGNAAHRTGADRI